MNSLKQISQLLVNICLMQSYCLFNYSQTKQGCFFNFTKSYLSVYKQVIYPDFSDVKIYGVTKIEQGL